MSDEVKFNQAVVCDVCGHFGAYVFDGESLCCDCYETRGSCCPEFGKKDRGSDGEAPRPQCTGGLRPPGDA